MTAVTITEWQLSHEWQVSQQPSGSLHNNRVAVVTKTEWFSYLISKAANVRSICNSEPLSGPPILDPSQMVLPFRALWPQFCCHHNIIICILVTDAYCKCTDFFYFCIVMTADGSLRRKMQHWWQMRVLKSCVWLQCFVCIKKTGNSAGTWQNFMNTQTLDYVTLQQIYVYTVTSQAFSLSCGNLVQARLWEELYLTSWTLHSLYNFYWNFVQPRRVQRRATNFPGSSCHN